MFGLVVFIAFQFQVKIGKRNRWFDDTGLFYICYLVHLNALETHKIPGTSGNQ